MSTRGRLDAEGDRGINPPSIFNKIVSITQCTVFYSCMQYVLYIIQLFTIICKCKSVARRLGRTKANWISYCHMAAQRAMWLAQRYFLNLNFSILDRFSLLLISSSYSIILTKLSRPRPRYGLKFLTCRKSNPGPLGWQSDMLTTIPTRPSIIYHIAL